jgi:membrane-bound lytic murein transglycosylase D
LKKYFPVFFFWLFLLAGCKSLQYIEYAAAGRDVNLIDTFGTDQVDLAELDKVELPGFSIADFNHPSVQSFIKTYQTTAKKALIAVLNRGKIYIPVIKKIFNENGIPEDLAYLPIIESGFRPGAVSPAGARGLWQFMYSTGRFYGLKADYWYDDRSNIYESTKAAARHLKWLYKRFGNWPLVLAAYNAGSGKIGRGVKQYKTKNFWELCTKRYYLKRETKNYVPKFIACVTVAKNPSHYGLPDLFNSDVPALESFTISDATDIKNVLCSISGVSLKTFKKYNPGLKRWATPQERPYTIYLPHSNIAVLKEQYEKIKPEDRITYRRHLTRIGENLTVISSKYNVTVNSIANLKVNNFKSKHNIAAGEYIFIPIRGLSRAKEIDKAKRKKFSKFSSKQYYSFLHAVGEYETVYTIAMKYNVDISDLFRWNGLKNKYDIRPGEFLLIRTSEK